MWRSFLDSSNNVDNTAAAGGAELNNTRLQCEESVVFATTNIGTRVKMGSALTHNDFSGVDNLSTETLHTQTLGITVTTVASTGRTFFMSHDSLPCRNIGYLDRGQLGTMSLTAAVAGLVLELENVNFHTAMMIHDFGGNGDFRQCCSICGDLGSVN
jgi:hypothetical protein